MNLDTHGILISEQIINDTVYLDTINNKLYDFLNIKNTQFSRTDNCLHHLLWYDKKILDHILYIIATHSKVKEYFNNSFIMHSCGAVINKPHKESYTHNWHIDTYEETNEKYMLNVLVPLTDFTLENGCTKIYPYNSDGEYKNILLKKGDILFFNSALKHCTGNNKSEYDRNCLTITLVKKYLKPQFNYISLFSEAEIEDTDEKLLVLYNYYSQIPDNLKDFYDKKYNIK